MCTEYAADYLEARGISGPDAIADALRRVFNSMEPLVHESRTSGLTEQAILREGELRLKHNSGQDLVTEGAVRFAALVERSLSAKDVAKQLKVTPNRVYQRLSSRELYSFRLDGKRLVPDFQFAGGKLIPNIAQVNKALSETMHPLGIFNWYHQKSADLFIDDEQETLLTPLEWLAEGRDPTHVIFMSKHL